MNVRVSRPDNVAFIVDEDVCTRCALCVDRCPTGVIIMGKVGEPAADVDGHRHARRLRLRVERTCNKDGQNGRGQRGTFTKVASRHVPSDSDFQNNVRCRIAADNVPSSR